MARLGIDRDFLREFGKLERPVQDKVYDVFAKFEQATHAGAHLEKINNALDPRLRSIRIDRFWRGILLAPETGDTYTLLKVLPHDDAYAWAQRRRVSVNRATGVIEVRDVVAIEQRLPELTQEAAQSPTRLLSSISNADLVRLGIDEEIMPFARALTDLTALEAERDILPEAQYDVLLGLAIGMTPEDVWQEMAGAGTMPTEYDPEDVTAAVERSTKRVLLVNGPDELMEVFSYPFALWRVYLHPLQQRMVDGTFSGPARVSGGPGTGKTVAALHRAKRLAERTSRDRSVLVTTFTTTLTDSLENGLRLLIEDEGLLRRLDIRSVNQLAYKVGSAVHGKLRVMSDDEETSLWNDVIRTFGLDVNATFLSEEWRQVVLARGLTTREDYFAAERRGRGRRRGESQRAQYWAAILAFTTRLKADRLWTYETMCVEATRLLNEADVKPYQHIVIDEAQDLSPWQWRLLRAAVAPARDDLFIAGDSHQQIYQHKVSLRQVGVNIAGRSERLRLNYRTTAEILGWSVGVLHGQRIEDIDGQLETLAGCRSEVHGSSPRLLQAPTRSAELQQLVATVRSWLDSGVEPDQIGVAARSNLMVDLAVKALREGKVPAVSLASRTAEGGELAVATMHRMKGLEFRCVALVGVAAGQVPMPAAVTPAEEDQATHDSDIHRERCLLFVACTRAREELVISWHGTRSQLLPT